MKINININCECGNSESITVKQEKEFQSCGIFTEQPTVIGSIEKSNKFYSYSCKMCKSEFLVSCKNCNREIPLF